MDLEISILLDTGAQITIFPEEVVPAAAKGGVKVRMKGYVVSLKLREVAEVRIRLGKRV